MIKLSISNIAWEPSEDDIMYSTIHELGYPGLEIAPNRIFPEDPYFHLKEAHEWSVALYEQFGLSISSMQSIWYGRNERLFGTAQERSSLMNYTKRAIDFANAIDCKNLVLGSPRNRNLNPGENPETAIPFFQELGDYAANQGTVLALEANPPIYQTNYINTTSEALKLVRDLNSRGVRVNLDLGTVIANKEKLNSISKELGWIHHVHISEPNLNEIKCRNIHRELEYLLHSDYSGYVSLEMKNGLNANVIFSIMRKVRELFYEI